MGSSNKSKRRALPANYVHKTADDFMRWLKTQDARKKQGAQEKIMKSDCVTSKALMICDDDGGAVENT
jgi:hypothetical protein